MEVEEQHHGEVLGGYVQLMAISMNLWPAWARRRISVACFMVNKARNSKESLVSPAVRISTMWLGLMFLLA